MIEFCKKRGPVPSIHNFEVRRQLILKVIFTNLSWWTDILRQLFASPVLILHGTWRGNILTETKITSVGMPPASSLINILTFEYRKYGTEAQLPLRREPWIKNTPAYVFISHVLFTPTSQVVSSLQAFRLNFYTYFLHLRCMLYVLPLSSSLIFQSIL
jgi:hypothetical protein